jgi:hypothetical protein
MRKQTKWMAVTAAVASGLAMAASAQAQGITGPQYLSNIDPANVSFTGVWVTPPATVTSTPLGLEINTVGGPGTFSTSYYGLPAGQIQPNDPAATEVTFSYIWNAGTPVGGVAVLFSLDDSNGGAADYYSTGYVIPQPGVNTFTFPLQAGNLADFAAGDVVSGINFQIDPANVSSPTYDITYSSITLVPEPTTLALAGLGAAGLLVLRRRK